MRDLSKQELGFVYGAGGTSKKCYSKPKCKGSRSKGSRSKGSRSKGSRSRGGYC